MKISKEKELLTVNVIQYNHKIEKLLQEMVMLREECINLDKNGFINQREILSRNKMNIRVINSAINMINHNKIQLWMIDEKAIEENINNRK
jgi:hypothetical protein